MKMAVFMTGSMNTNHSLERSNSNLLFSNIWNNRNLKILFLTVIDILGTVPPNFALFAGKTREVPYKECLVAYEYNCYANVKCLFGTRPPFLNKQGKFA